MIEEIQQERDVMPVQTEFRIFSRHDHNHMLPVLLAHDERTTGLANSEKMVWNTGFIASGPFKGPVGMNSTASDE